MKKKRALIAYQDKTGETARAIDKAVSKSNGKYSSRSHFIKIAVNSLLVAELYPTVERETFGIKQTDQ